MRRTSSSNSGHPQQHLHQHGTRRPRSGSGDGSTDGFDNKKNAAAHQNQKKPFVFGVLLGATVAYSLSALSESIRLSHAVHHYVHHEVSDFNLLGIGGPGKRTTNRGRKMKKKEDAEDSDEGSGGDDGDSDVDSEDKTGKVNAGINEDVTDDALLENLKAAAAAKREDENRMRPGMPRFGGNNGGGQDERKKKLLERLEMRRQQEQQQKEQNKKQIVHPVNPNNNLSKLEVAKRPQKEHTFDERIAQNMGRQPPQDQNARFAKNFPYQLDAPITDKVLDDLDLRDICDVEKNVLNVKEARRICLEGKLPDYTHPKPHFLPSTDDEEVWLKQPENEISIKENWVNWSWQTCINLKPGADHIAGRVDIGGIDSFQHFHDNALGMVYQMRHAYDFLQRAAQPCRFTESLTVKRPNQFILFEEWDLLGFSQGTKNKVVNRMPRPSDILVELTFYPQDFDQVRVHPVHVEWLRSKFPPDRPVQKDKVIFISRQGSNKGNTGRQFKNEDDFLNGLRKRIPSLQYFHPGKERIGTVEALKEYLGDACLLIGLHGGHMYNQYFANTKTAVLELMAVDSRGLLHNQKTRRSRPTLGHRAMWHNANLIRQPYWRIQFQSPKGTGFEMSDSIIDEIFQVATNAGCSIKA